MVSAEAGTRPAHVFVVGVEEPVELKLVLPGVLDDGNGPLFCMFPVGLVGGFLI